MHVLMTAYSWAENNGGAAMIRQNARALLRQGHQVSMVWTATTWWWLGSRERLVGAEQDRAAGAWRA